MAVVRDQYSDVLCLYDLGLDTFTVSEDPVLSPYYVDIFFGFRYHGHRNVILSDVIGVVLEIGSERFEYPEPNTRWVRSDQEYILCKRWSVVPGSQLTFTFKVSSRHGHNEITHTLSIPIPKQPYPSWTYDETTHSWIAPVPYPNDPDHMYHWNEDTQSWVALMPSTQST